MAFRDITRGLKNFFGPNNRFFNGAREEESGAEEAYYPQNAAPAYPPEATFANGRSASPAFAEKSSSISSAPRAESSAGEMATVSFASGIPSATSSAIMAV